MMPTLYTKKEAAEYLKCSVKNISVLVATGRLNSTKIGGRRMFTEKHFLEMIKEGEV